MKRKLLIALAVIVLSAGSVAGYFWRDYQAFVNEPLAIESDQIFLLSRGTGFSAVATQLKDKGWLDNLFYFKALARKSKLASKMKAGEYEIPVGTTPLQLLELFASGRSIQHKLTIIEGSSLKELRSQLANDARLEQELPSIDDAGLLKALNYEATSPEGLFLAETYQFQRGDSDLDILKRAHKLLKDKLDTAWQQRAEKGAYKQPYEALIMASIIEKETGQPSERPVIAGVFVRRLDKGMRLQTDPTVIYGMGNRYKGNIRRSDLRRPTPYNTYVIRGLPPTPIAMVGQEAIVAALNPAEGKALYFVAKGDGSHVFSNNLRDHNNAVRKYQLKRRSNYRSSPEQKTQ